MTTPSLTQHYPILAETRLLKPVAVATVPARTEPFDVAAFYHRIGIHGTFADRLGLNTRQMVNSVPEKPYVALLLKADAYDRDIRKELPERQHLSTPEDIAALIDSQPGGKPGFLLTNENCFEQSICYVEGRNGEVVTMVIGWHDTDRQWVVGDWRRDGYGYWYAGNQVLCPGYMSL
jgi:hypothetical protein